MKRIVLLTIALFAASPAWAVSECLDIKAPVPYAECVVAWENDNLRADYPFPDLLDRLHRTRLELAARFERGKISATGANAALKRVEAEVYAEGRNRISAQYGSVARHLDAAASRRSVDCLGLNFEGGVSFWSCD